LKRNDNHLPFFWVKHLATAQVHDPIINKAIKTLVEFEEYFLWWERYFIEEQRGKGGIQDMVEKFLAAHFDEFYKSVIDGRTSTRNIWQRNGFKKPN
jgi:hypothetical protein